MSRLQRAFLKIPPFPAVPVKLIEEYVLTGDRDVLAKIQSFPKSPPIFASSEGNALAGALAPLPKWTDEDRRLLHVLCARNLLGALGPWLDDALGKEKPGEDVVAVVRAELESCQAAPHDINSLFKELHICAHDGKPTSAGRFILGLSDPELRDAIKQDVSPGIGMGKLINLEMLGFLLDFAPERISALLEPIDRSGNQYAAAGLILKKGGAKFEKEMRAMLESTKDTWQRFLLARELFAFDAATYRDVTLRAARASLAGSARTNNHNTIGEWMLESFGPEAIPDLVAYIAAPQEHNHFKAQIITAAEHRLKSESLPILQAALKTNDPELGAFALPTMIAIRDDSQDELIAEALKRGFADKTRAVGFIAQAAQWKPSLVAESLWELSTNKSKPVREAAARVLGRLGDATIPRAGKLLFDKKADTRSFAVAVLATVGSAQALGLLEERVDDESDEDVHDAMFLALASARAASGRTVTRREIDARIRRLSAKLKQLPAAWINESRLPALKFKDGEPLPEEAVRYMLYRQSRTKEIRPDVEASSLLGTIDRETGGAFAVEILKQFLGSKVDAGDRWVLALAAALGDDRIVPIVNQQIRQWADSNRGKMAEYAVEALSLLGSDAALLTIDALAIRYKAKNKNVGRAAVDAFAAAADRLGITPAELGDRVVPWLGFEPGQKRIFDCGGKQVEAKIGSDLKLQFIDLEKNKKLASLPKSAPKEIAAEFKELGAALRQVVKAQVLRLENLMVRQQRWPVDRWTELFTLHPVLSPLASRLIWGVYDDGGKLGTSFRPLEDRTLTQAGDVAFTLPAQGRIGVVHPLELTESEHKAWQTHLADYEITPPFAQLERPVVRLEPDGEGKMSLTEHAGTTINAMTFRSRAERLGWARGSVCDGGGITTYWKSFPAAGVDVFLGLDGMYIGIDMSSDIKLQKAFFVRSGSVQVGSYTYDEPADENDKRVLAFGELPPIVYSETLGDLRKISGRGESAEDDDE